MHKTRREEVSNAAECELTLHPENSRAAYLGAKASSPLVKATGKEWLNRSIAIDPEDLLDPVQCRPVLTQPLATRGRIRFARTSVTNANHETKAWI